MKRLWYFADPMCSWCWGFAPVISAIEERYRGRFAFELVMGGLRPGTREPATPRFRDEILHHWREVHRLSGQPFAFDGAMPDGFVYDTEPSCRAVVTMTALRPGAAFAYFKSIQAAFYADGRDVTRSDTLAVLAQSFGVAADAFTTAFDAPEAKQQTAMQFYQTAQAGVRGFPTVALQDDRGATLLTSGYRPLVDLQPRLDAWLADND